MQMNANQLTKIPVEKLSDTLHFLIAENEIPLSDALKQVIDDVDAVCKKLLRDESAPAKPVIPEGLIKAINRLLDNDGSRGCFDALEQHRAKTELERLLAAAQQNEPQNIPENIPAQPVSGPYKFPQCWKLVPIEPTAEMAQAARDCHEGESFLPYSIYRAMLAAAPTAQEQK